MARTVGPLLAYYDTDLQIVHTESSMQEKLEYRAPIPCSTDGRS